MDGPHYVQKLSTRQNLKKESEIIFRFKRNKFNLNANLLGCYFVTTGGIATII